MPQATDLEALGQLLFLSQTSLDRESFVWILSLYIEPI